MAKAFQSKGANLFVWILIALLILGLAGFGIGNFTGTASSVGSVGDEEISVNDYWRELQNELRALSGQAGRSIALEEGLDFGVGRLVMQRLVTEAALDNEASRIGLSVGDENVLEDLRQTPEFVGLDGEFDQAQYEFVLERSGWTAAEYDEIIRELTARTILQSAVAGALQPPDSYIERIILFYFEGRDFSWAPIGPALLQDDLPEPTDADLTAYYNANPEEFTLPETREITFAWVTPDMLSQIIEIDDDALRARYEDLSDEYNVPERRLVERMVFPSMEEALGAKRRLDSGEIGFSELATERGLSLSDLNLGEIRRGALNRESDAAIFSLDDPGVTDPAQSDLGPAIYSVNAILLARRVSYEDALPDLVARVAMDGARRTIFDSMSGWDDLIAAGATLEELAEETELQIGTVAYNSLSTDEIAGYDEFRRAAETATEDDFPELYELADGGVFALRLDRIVPPTVQPFEQARAQARSLWEASQVKKSLLELAEVFETEMRAGNSFYELGLTPFQANGVSRGDPVDGTPDGLVTEIFAMEPGESIVVDDGEIIALAKLEAINPADLESEDARRVAEAVRLQNSAEIGRDAFVLFANEVQNQAGIEIDQSIIDAVHAQVQ